MSDVIQTLEHNGQPVATWERLDDGPAAGVDVVTLRFGGTTARICPTRGMGILDVHVGDVRAGWDSPVGGPIHPALVNLESRNKLGWLDGFSELLVRCGLAFMGPPGADDEAGPIAGDLTLHGRVANIPASGVAISCDDGGVTVRGTVDEAVLFGPRLRLVSETRVTSDGAVLVRDEVMNCGPSPAEYQLLYHINVGKPILGEAARIAVESLAQVWPRDPRAAEGVDGWDTCMAPTAGYAEQAYFFETRADTAGLTKASLINADGTAFHVGYDATQLPCLTLWKCTQELEAGYVVGLEPGTSYPNHKSFERRHGRVPVLAPGERAVKELTLSVGQGVDVPVASDDVVVNRVPDEPICVRP